ncbi:MAG: hypothetical protein ACLTLI_02685 [Clostridia bacterium]
MQNIRTDLAVEAREFSRREAKNATEIDGVIRCAYRGRNNRYEYRNNKRKRK